ncbi:MAG: hypothetical protein IJ705_02850, partial [Oscillospiraceae bacterium]|nr:hypothetical protein [Oscillospiraceae bacterium]
MKSITVTKPNMAVVGQERMGLSPFGLLSALFLKELAGRTGLEIGEAYRPLKLELLEEEAPERERAAPGKTEIHVDLDLNVALKTLREELKKEKKQPALSAEQRILERVILREREMRVVEAEKRRVVIQSGPQRWELRLPLAAAAVAPSLPEDQASVSRTERTRESPGGRALRVSTEMPLASSAAAAPGAGGWTPQRQPLHPGYPPEDAQRASGNGPEAGSILLPDVLRRRREEFLERQNSAPSAAEQWAPVADALEWAAERSEPGGAVERMMENVRRSVQETLRRSRQSLEERSRGEALSQSAGDTQLPPRAPEWREARPDRFRDASARMEQSELREERRVTPDHLERRDRNMPLDTGSANPASFISRDETALAESGDMQRDASSEAEAQHVVTERQGRDGSGQSYAIPTAERAEAPAAPMVYAEASAPEHVGPRAEAAAKETPQHIVTKRQSRDRSGQSY